jgi:hypothetical protein
VDLNDAVGAFHGIAIAVVGWSVYYCGRAATRLVSKRAFPLEKRILQFLQDRAASRALGVDIGVLRARRKMDGYG